MKNVILINYPEYDYALVARCQETEPMRAVEFIAAWHPEIKGGITWGQGHYFTNLAEAMAYMNALITIKSSVKAYEAIRKE